MKASKLIEMLQSLSKTEDLDLYCNDDLGNIYTIDNVRTTLIFDSKLPMTPALILLATKITTG